MKLPELDKKYNVVIIGDVMLDHYVMGEVHRNSPEADVRILDNHQEYSRLGGAANVALNIKELGSIPILMSIIGDDREADSLLQLCHDQHISIAEITQEKNRKTTQKTRFYNQNDQLLRVDREDTDPISDAQSDDLLTRLADLIQCKKVDAIILQDYNKGVLTTYNIPKIITLARQFDIKVFVDPKEHNFFAYRNCYLFKPNLREIAFAYKAEIDINNVSPYAAQLQEALAAQSVVITLSEHGIYCLSEDYKGIRPCHPGTIVDVCGAGDSVISSVCIADLHDIKMAEIIELANYVAYNVCQSLGATPYIPRK